MPPTPSPLTGLLDSLGSGRRRQVLTHRSWARSRAESYERLEFLGDSVLQLVVTEELMRLHPDAPEGDMAWMRQQVVSRDVCAAAARAAGLPDLMVREAPPRRTPDAERTAAQPSVQSALAEAVIGAAWLDLDRGPVADAVLAAFASAIAAAVPGRRDPKTTLQERIQRHGGQVSYALVHTIGPTHDRMFHVRAISGGRVLGEGLGPSKQLAERQAAVRALAALGAEDAA